MHSRPTRRDLRVDGLVKQFFCYGSSGRLVFHSVESKLGSMRNETTPSMVPTRRFPWTVNYYISTDRLPPINEQEILHL